MGYYPISLDLVGRPCLVVGGGAIAERKVAGLVEAGARVTVVSPSLTSALLQLATEAPLRWRPSAGSAASGSTAPTIPRAATSSCPRCSVAGR